MQCKKSSVSQWKIEEGMVFCRCCCLIAVNRDWLSARVCVGSGRWFHYFPIIQRPEHLMPFFNFTLTHPVIIIVLLLLFLHFGPRGGLFGFDFVMMSSMSKGGIKSVPLRWLWLNGVMSSGPSAKHSTIHHHHVEMIRGCSAVNNGTSAGKMPWMIFSTTMRMRFHAAELKNAMKILKIQWLQIWK